MAYLISKNSNRPYFGAAPNALSASNIGLKGTEELFPGLSGVFNLQTSFLPTSGKRSDGLGSIVENNGVALDSQSGQLDAVSFVVDYRFAKRWDAYAGAMYSQVRNGMANGFLNRSTIDPTVGLRFQFRSKIYQTVQRNGSSGKVVSCDCVKIGVASYPICQSTTGGIHRGQLRPA